MIGFPPAKVNIGLDVLHKRPDGFHAIRSIFYPVPLFDVLELIPDTSQTGLTLSTSGIPIPGTLSENLCVSAHRLVHEAYGIGGVRAHLRKNIPIGAGLGGGSADGAWTLRLLDRLFALEMPEAQLRDMAAELGSDCPFFLQDGAMLVTGRGEKMQEHALDLGGKHMVLLMPDFGIATGPAYASIVPQEKPDALSDLHDAPMSTWDHRAVNHFETGSLPAYQQVAALKEALLESGAAFASMTGSGAAVYGLFDSVTDFSPPPGVQAFHLDL